MTRDQRTGAALQRGSHNGYRNQGNRDQRGRMNAGQDNRVQGNQGQGNRGERNRGQRVDAAAQQRNRAAAAQQARQERRVSRREALQTRDRAEQGAATNNQANEELRGGRGRRAIERRDRDRGVVIP